MLDAATLDAAMLDAIERKANDLLCGLRQSPMRRGAISGARHQLRRDIGTELEAQGIPAALAQRIAFQLVFKCDPAELGDQAVWRGVGRALQAEIVRLRTRVGLADRQIVAVLPKLSARHVEEFLDELLAADRTIARTILNAALQAADPLSAGRRYLSEYREVAEELRAIDPTVARTLANATFTAGAPRRKAMEHLQQFAALMAPDAFLRDSNAVIATLTSSGVEGHLARTLASSRQLRRYIRKKSTT